MDRAKEVLAATFGFEGFREGQEAVVRCLLEGRSALAVFPTGGGKSLCYQLPALLLDGLTVVVSPLIALMKDQVDALVGRGIAAGRWDSSMEDEAILDLEGRLKRGELKLLYLAPERLANEATVKLLGSLKISLLAVDEAHCISEWGHHFRPDYLKVAGVSRMLGAPVLGLTATATSEVCSDIRVEFGIALPDHYQTSFRRPNLNYAVVRCDESEKRVRLEAALNKDGALPAIVYVTLQETAGRVAAMLRESGIAARPYHAGLPAECRSEVQDGFMGGEIPVVVATIAFGMGIDKGDVRSVIHYNLPKSLENYVQETGRAGRDGGESSCLMLACGDDLTVLENFVYGDSPSDASVGTLVDSVMRRGESVEISRYDLSLTHDMRPLVLGTLLAHLELAGILEDRGVVYRRLKIKLGGDDEEIIAGYDEEQKAFLRKVLKAGKRGWRWLTLEPAAAAVELGESEERIRGAIGDLEEAGDVSIEATGVMQRYCRIREPETVAGLVEEAREMFKKREEADLERIAAVVAFAESGECLTRQLVGYFGEEMGENCGGCSWCCGESDHGEMGRGRGGEIVEEDLVVIHELIGERRVALRTPRQLARFLCGITSPATTRARLTRDDRFGMLEGYPFRDVLAFVREMNLA